MLAIAGRVVSALVIWLIWAWMRRRTRRQIKQHPEKEYDYIVVGGGSAGCVLAARLSEDPTVRVLLLEAGPDEQDNPDVNIPSAVARLMNSPLDWQYKTVPQKHACHGLNNNQSNWPRGKVLGGSSCLNFMVYSRGSPHDYDEWSENGCEGWSYAECLPYFIKSEGNSDKTLLKSGLHGKDGPLKITTVDVTGLGSVFLRAAQQLGYNLTDVNGRNQLGFQQVQAFLEGGERCHTARAFLRPAMSRPNLHVVTGVHVTKVLFEGKRAAGVQYLQNGNFNSVETKKEIILSAGAIGSPQILMLSGVGPKGHLQETGVDAVADLPVGENLQDHIFTDAVAYLIDKPISMTPDKVDSIKSRLQYKLFGTGYLAMPGSIEALGFVRSHLQDPDKKYPDIQFHLQSAIAGNRKGDVPTWKNVKQEVWDALNGDNGGKEGIMLLPFLLHPMSKGTIKLASTNPADHPLIDPCYLYNELDVKVLVEAIKIGRSFGETDAFKELGAKLYAPHHPACRGISQQSDEYWATYVRNNTYTLYHPSGTCKMGATSDPSTVVDPKLRVKGIDGLRVVDASIMPNVVSGNTNAPVIMIAEKAADIIKDHYARTTQLHVKL